MPEEDVNQAVSIKMPTFSEDSCGLFLKIIKAEFSLKNVTVDKTNLYNTPSLPTDVLSNVPITIINGENYEEFKKQIISFEKSKTYFCHNNDWQTFSLPLRVSANALQGCCWR